jgi:PAS domain S-box-containing protein
MEYYKELLNDKSFSGIIVILDNKSNIIDTNEQFLNLLGYNFEDVLNRHITDLVVPDEKSLFFDLVYTQDISNNMILKFYHKSGAFRFFSFSILNFDKQKILFGNTLKKDFLAKKYEYVSKKNELIENIFENIDADDIKEVLSFQDNSLSLLLDLMPVEIWVKDKLGKYIFINETFIKATGMSFTESILKDDYQLFSPETAKSFVETDELAKSSGKKLSYNYETSDEKLASFAEVTKIPIYNKKGKYIGLLGFSVNTTYTKSTEILLQKEKERLLFVLANLNVMVFEINPKQELIFISENLRKLLGMKMENKDLIDLFFANKNNVNAREKLNLAFNGEKVIIEIEIMEKLVSFKINPVKNNEGTYNIIGITNNVFIGGE